MWLPKKQDGRRTDGRNLTREWRDAHPNGVYVEDEAGFKAIDVGASGSILGSFNSSHMQHEAYKANDIATEPTLSEPFNWAAKHVPG